MDFYWLYDIPTWEMFLLVIAVTCGIGLVGCLVFRRWFDRKLGLGSESNEIVSNFLAFTGVFYGIVLGLVAVGAWDTFNDASGRAEREASSLASFYRVITQLPEPDRSEIQGITRDYVVQVIERAWPAQQRGEVPEGGDPIITALAERLFRVQATTPNIEITLEAAVSEFSDVVEARRARIASVDTSLPSSLWWVIIIGTLINMAMTWMLSIKNQRLDIVVNMLMAVLLGSVLAFVIAMDNPYRGELSVGPDAYQIVLDRVMAPDSGNPR
jgi:hypothetical protein